MPAIGALAIFALGVVLSVLLGGLIAAYDLWGGVPRHLWPLARLLATTAVLALGGGGYAWIVTHPKGRRLRAALRGAVVLALLAALCGGGLFAHYAVRWESSRRICEPALTAPTRAEREAALREGLGPLFPVIDPHSSCLELERQRRELLTSGACPQFVMDDVPCRCGATRWVHDHPARCRSGPTTCQMRGDQRALGCAEGLSRTNP